MRMSVDLPLMVHVIDSPDIITALAEVYGAMVGCGLITVEDVNVLLYCGDKAEAAEHKALERRPDEP
jgi:PII-like signaling protein